MGEQGASAWDAEVSTIRGVLSTRVKGFADMPEPMQTGLASAALVIAIQEHDVVEGVTAYLMFDLETRRAKGL